MKKFILIATLFVALTIVTMAQNTINNSFFDHVNYLGAFGDDDWTAGWSEFDPENAVYPVGDTTINFTNINSGQTLRLTSGVSPVLGSGLFSNPRLQDPWWTPVNYIGAFDGTNDWTAGWSEWDPDNQVYPPTTTTIAAGEITGNVTWVNTQVYKLNGFLYVRDGAILTIQAGTIIRGDKTNKGTIIVERGGKLIAQGTAAQPIVFTSNQAAGNRAAGDWGGIILLGKAAINEVGGVATIEGGVGSVYGGGTNPNNNDNSGILKYVRIEFPGVAFQPNDEINGLTMGGVGKGTMIDYVQVSYSGDDSFEWFGGTVDAKHLIAFKGVDDDMDTDVGYTGRVQFAVILRDPAIADVSGSRAFETDGDNGAGIQSFASQTRPLYSNISVFGAYPTINSPVLNSDHDVAMKIREGSECSIYNSFMAGWLYGLEIDGAQSENSAAVGNLQLQQVYLAGSKIRAFEDSGSGIDFDETFFMTPAYKNAVFTTNATLRIDNPFNLTNPDFQPSSTPQTYKLDGRIYVNDGAKLYIEPGTIFRCTQKGEPTGGPNNGSAIIVQRGGQIFAEGTLDKPIIFTSSNGIGARAAGDWAGIIVCGYATMNQVGGTAVIEGGASVTYGGGATPDDSDNSGILKYVRIEFAGYTFAPNNEINGLTLGAVGNGTTLDYIQVSYGNDDSFEWFGGTVNAKHLISLRTDDDDFDGDEGWNGMVQYAVAYRDPLTGKAGSHGFEISNHGAPPTNVPVTHPIFSNVDIFVNPAHSPAYGDAIHLKDNTEFELWNSLTFGFDNGLNFSGTGVQTNASNGLIQIHSTFMADHNTLYAGTTEQPFFEAPARDNATYALYSDYQLTNPLNLTAPDFRPSNPSIVRHRSYWTVQMTGTVTYENTANTAMDNITVTLNDVSKGIVLSTTTNASGQFTFPRVGEGPYTLTASSPDPWPTPGSIVKASDALDTQKHFVGTITEPLTAMQLLAADVDKSGLVNSSDALAIQKRGAGIAVPSWSAPDWIFSSIAISVGSSNVTQDLKGIVSGDVQSETTVLP